MKAVIEGIKDMTAGFGAFVLISIFLFQLVCIIDSERSRRK